MGRTHLETTDRFLKAEGAPIFRAPFNKDKVLADMAYVAATIDADDTALVLNCAKHFPATGVIMTKSGEKIAYGGKTGNTLTPLTRAQDSTTAAAVAAGELVAVIPTGQTIYAPSEFSVLGYCSEDGITIADKKTWKERLVERGSLGKTIEKREISIKAKVEQSSIHEIADILGVDVVAHNDMFKLDWTTANSEYAIFAMYKVYNESNAAFFEVFKAYQVQVLSDIEWTNARYKARQLPWEAQIYEAPECAVPVDGPYQVYQEALS